MVLALAMLLVGCGSAEPSATDGGSGLSAHAANTEGALAKPTKVTLILDFVPNAVHAGIYRALAAGYYRRENVDLQVIEPTSTQETLKLIDAGKAQFGLADGSDVAGLIDQDGDGARAAPARRADRAGLRAPALAGRSGR
jgi:putative hydroxymethylpyrimidine transport system substrate-binding protein